MQKYKTNTDGNYHFVGEKMPFNIPMRMDRYNELLHKAQLVMSSA